MKAELDVHLAASDEPNRKNGSTPGRVKSPVGEFDLQTPRDRAGCFEPQLVKNHQTHLTDELERKIIALSGLGNRALDASGAEPEPDAIAIGDSLRQHRVSSHVNL